MYNKMNTKNIKEQKSKQILPREDYLYKQNSSSSSFLNVVFFDFKGKQTKIVCTFDQMFAEIALKFFQKEKINYEKRNLHFFLMKKK